MSKPIKMYDGGNDFFLRCCDAGGVAPTRRQYSRYLQGRGMAFKSKEKAVRKQLKA